MDHLINTEAVETTADDVARPQLLSVGTQPTVRVPIASLSALSSPRLTGENEEHTRLLAESGARLPPIIVHRTTMRVIDGMHRVRAATLRGEAEIEIRFFDGSEDDAFLLAVVANIAHGLPLSLADRTAATVRIMASHPQWSDRAIAVATGVTPKTVATIRNRATDVSPQLRTRVGRDGRVRPLDSTKGRERVSDLLKSNPEASLRQIAAMAGVSQGTARDVRDRLLRGESPVPLQRGCGQARRDGADRDGSTTGRHDDNRERQPVTDRLSRLRNLKKDPALRFNEMGRCLIRLLDFHAMDEESQKMLYDSVPTHCAETVSELAYECAQKWQDFAHQMAYRAKV